VLAQSLRTSSFVKPLNVACARHEDVDALGSNELGGAGAVFSDVAQ
jgi:hypothetical protein